jgi:hypothetical protein
MCDARAASSLEQRTAALLDGLALIVVSMAVFGVLARTGYWTSSDGAVSVCNTLARVPEPFDLDLLDAEDPFEIDDQAAHLFKHPRLGVEDIYDVWQSDPLFYPAKPPAHWLMVAEVAGVVLVVPLAPSDSVDRTTCRPIGCYVAANHLVTRYREDR